MAATTPNELNQVDEAEKQKKAAIKTILFGVAEPIRPKPRHPYELIDDDYDLENPDNGEK